MVRGGENVSVETKFRMAQIEFFRVFIVEKSCSLQAGLNTVRDLGEIMLGESGPKSSKS